MKGTVKWFDKEKGYGFITGDDRKDVFVHYSGIVCDGFKNLEEGQAVTFDTKVSEKGTIAVNVVSEEANKQRGGIFVKAGLMLAVNPNSEREKDDFYATDPYAIDVAINAFNKIGVDKNIWECACGKGHLSEKLKYYGFNVYSTDLVDREYGEQLDFLKYDKTWNGDILTNPPFKLAPEFIEKSMDILEDGHKAIFFLKVQFLESDDRKKLFKKYPPKYILVNSTRICCAMNGEFDKYFKKKKEGMYGGGTQCYCWFVFEKGYTGQTIVNWVELM